MPVSNFGLPPRGQRLSAPDDMPPELAATATRMDLVILAFVLGAWLGSLISGQG